MNKDYFLDPSLFKAEEIIKEDHTYVLDTGFKEIDLVLVSGNGCRVKDINGKEYIDFNSSIANVSSGYNNKYIISALKKQLDLLIHSHVCTINIPKVKVAKLMVNIYPKKANMKKFLTSGGGSEANEAMFKLARRFTRDKNATAFISWWEAYHGATYGALSATCQKTAKPAFYEPLTPNFMHVPMPNCYNCAFGKKYPRCKMQCAKFLKDFIEVHGPEKFVGMLFEPIISAAGGIVPPKEYFEIVYEICEKKKIVLMFDEVVTGFGRTGKLFASEHYNIYPKMASFGKSFSSGYATISGVLVNEEISKMGGFGDNWHGFTCTGNVFSNAAAYANIKYIIDNNLTKNAEEMGNYMKEKLSKLMNMYPGIIGTIRGKGLAGSIVFKNKILQKDINLIVKKAFEKGLILKPNNRMRDKFIWLYPELIIDKDEMDFSLDIIFKSFEEVFK